LLSVAAAGEEEEEEEEDTSTETPAALTDFVSVSVPLRLFVLEGRDADDDVGCCWGTSSMIYDEQY
jgi:hypothetical protein